MPVRARPQRLDAPGADVPGLPAGSLDVADLAAVAGVVLGETI